MIVSNLVGLMFAIGVPAAEPAIEEGTQFFENHVRPLLVARCYECHSSASEEVQGALLLDSRAGWEQGGESGASIVPGNPDASLLVKAVRYDDDSPQMPPKGKLSAEEIGVLEKWVSMGAPDPREGAAAKIPGRMIDLEEGRQYWAFQPVVRPSLPSVAQVDWMESSVDSFVLSRLEAEGIRPSDPAAEELQLRRAYLDVVGLPPTIEERKEFLASDRPDRYARLVDRLLASSRFGERWGRHWLDVARFAESFGFEHDYDREYAYHYRDFVIRSMNSDMPYDQFVRWQLAGDEFAPENPEALAATGFLAAGVFPTQITANEVERTRYDALDDMLATTGSAMLGLSIGCARCHDHKFDPIPAEDYYRMLSTFTTTVRCEVEVDLDPESTRRTWNAFESKRRDLSTEVDRIEREVLPSRLRAWLRDREGVVPSVTGWVLPETVEAKSVGGATLARQSDGSYLVSGANPDHDVYEFVLKTGLVDIRSLRAEALSDASLVKGGPGRAGNGNFGLTRVRVFAAPADDRAAEVEVALRNARATFEQKGLGAAGVLKETGGCWAVDPAFGRDHALAVDFAEPIGFPEGTVLKVRLEFKCNKQHAIGRPRLSISTAADSPSPGLALLSPSLVMGLERIREGEDFKALSEAQVGALVEWYRWRDADWQQKHRLLSEHLSKAPRPVLTKMMIASEGVAPLRKHTQGADFFPETYILKRGDVNLKSGVASQNFMQVLMPVGYSSSNWQEVPPEGVKTSYRRRGLANWMIDCEHGAGGLAARVIVNRIWQHYFGRGIVSTPNDFGVQGDPPTHPEMLEWLADELIDGDWQMKRLHRLMLSSATYQQSSESVEASVAKDPDNRLFWRFTPRRLEAEPIRDSLLYTSGLLDTTMFGRGTMDPGQRRRSVYFTVKRSQLTPMLQLFDAPDTLTSLGRRSQTTIAPQALVFLNDPHVRRWAESLGRNLADPLPASREDAVARVYGRVLGRDPTSEEVALGVSLWPGMGDAWDADTWTRAMADLVQVLYGTSEFVYLK